MRPVENLVVPFTPHVQKAILQKSEEEVKSAEYCDTAFSAGTLNAARRAAGAVAHAVDRILLGRNRNAFCVVRPPGHHAGYQGLLQGSRSCGFCIFNSVAGGALHALEEHQCERVAIVDLDIHHGNGTEDIVRRFRDPSKLFFFSVHLLDKDNADGYEFFPGSGSADDTKHNITNAPIDPLWMGAPPAPRAAPQTRGQQRALAAAATVATAERVGLGASSAANASVNSVDGRDPPRSGRLAYRAAISQRLVPALRAFNPSIILLSMGLDAAAGDLGNSKATTAGSFDGGMDLTLEDFRWVTAQVLQVADICCSGRVVSVLEGGYGCCKPNVKTELDRTILGRAAAAHVSALVDPLPFMEEGGRGKRDEEVSSRDLKRDETKAKERQEKK